MMKNKIILALLMLTITITGCATNNENSQTALSSNVTSSAGKPTYEQIDYDLTKMNANMVYATVLNIMENTSAYIGKVIKARGPFRPFDGLNPDYCYPAIVIQDATACCASGLEFLLYDVPRCSRNGGNGYPELEEEVTIVGRLETYLDYYTMYIRLGDAIWLKD